MHLFCKKSLTQAKTRDIIHIYSEFVHFVLQRSKIAKTVVETVNKIFRGGDKNERIVSCFSGSYGARSNRITWRCYLGVH